MQAGLWTPELSVVVGEHAQGVWFVVATVIWTLFTLQDAVLTGLGEAPWVFVENVSYGVLKLALLLAVADRLPRTGVFVAWTAPLIVFVVAINLLIFGRLIPQRRHPPAERIDARVIGRFISADYPASLMLATVVGLMPLLAITITGSAKSSAYVYLAWTFAYTLHLVSTNVGGSMITEASRAPERLVEYARRTVVHALRIVVPLAVILVIAAPYVLRIEGRDYAIHTTRLLQLFAIAAIPNVFVATYLNIIRVERRMAAVLYVTAIQSVLVLVPSIVMLHLYGVVGVGIAWLGAETVIALALLVGELRTLWLPYLPAQSLRALVDRASVSQLRLTSRATRRAVLQTFDESNLNAHGWVPREFVGHTHEVGVLRVSLPSWREEGLLKVAMSPLGLESLHRELSALKTVRDSAPPDIDNILPRVLKFDPKPERAWLLETWFDGIDARSAIEIPGAVDTLLADVTRRMTSLYRLRSATLRVDDDAFTRLVDLPLMSTGNTRTTHMGAIADSRNLAKVRDELHGELAGRDLVMSLIHGDLWLGNVLWDPATVEVRGIIDWHSATVAFPVVDIVHLICTTRSLTQHRELGSIVQEILAGGAPAARGARPPRLRAGRERHVAPHRGAARVDAARVRRRNAEQASNPSGSVADAQRLRSLGEPLHAVRSRRGNGQMIRRITSTLRSVGLLAVVIVLWVISLAEAATVGDRLVRPALRVAGHDVRRARDPHRLDGSLHPPRRAPVGARRASRAVPVHGARHAGDRVRHAPLRVGMEALGARRLSREASRGEPDGRRSAGVPELAGLLHGLHLLARGLRTEVVGRRSPSGRPSRSSCSSRSRCSRCSVRSKPIAASRGSPCGSSRSATGSARTISPRKPSRTSSISRCSW